MVLSNPTFTKAYCQRWRMVREREKFIPNLPGLNRLPGGLEM
jgi:hypothetical protein